MSNAITAFLKKTYKIIGVFIIAGAFFIFYNVYLVDHSVINLRAALAEASTATTVEDFEKIKPLLKIVLLKAVASRITSTNALLSLEMTDDIASTAKYKEQIKDVQFYLRTLIVAAEKERGAFLSTIDRLNTTFFPPTVKLSEKELNAEARKLSDKIASIKGKAELQEAYFNLGNVYLLAADVRNAETALAAAWQVIPDNDIAVKAKFNLAWFYKIIGKYEEAATYFGKITKEFPKSELAIVSRIETADILYKRKEYLKARDMYAALAKEYPAAEFAKFTLFRAGYISLYNLNDKKAALRFFALLEKILPDEAIASYTKTHMRKVIFGKIVSEGYKALMENKYDEAIKKFKKATKVNPHDPASYSGMGVGYFWLDKKDKALEKAREAVSLSAEDEIALTNSLYIYIMSNKIDDAIKLANDVLNKTPIANAEFHYNLGCANLKKNDVNKAKGTFIHAIEKDSSLACAYNNLGYVYWLDGDYAEAVVKFKEAIGINPKYALAHYNLGVIYFYLNQPEEAYKEFKGALRIKPSDAKASDYLRRLEGILKYKPE